MKLMKLTGLALASVVLTGCFQQAPEVKYVDVRTGQPVEVIPAKVIPALKSHPTALVPKTRSATRYLTREDGTFVYIDKAGQPQYGGLTRICIDGIVYLSGTHVLTPHLVRDTSNHPLLDDEDSGSRVRLEGITCQ